MKKWRSFFSPVVHKTQENLPKPLHGCIADNSRSSLQRLNILFQNQQKTMLSAPSEQKTLEQLMLVS
jgi:hypothetical protein